MGLAHYTHIFPYIPAIPNEPAGAIAFQLLCHCEEGVSPTKQSPGLQVDCLPYGYPYGMLRDRAGPCKNIGAGKHRP
jgi:hypothetical protein